MKPQRKKMSTSPGHKKMKGLRKLPSVSQCQTIVTKLSVHDKKPFSVKDVKDGNKEHATQVNTEETSLVVNQSFVFQEPVQEDSIADDSIGEIPDDDHSVQYQVIEECSSSGKRKLCGTDGFSYAVKVQMHT